MTDNKNIYNTPENNDDTFFVFMESMDSIMLDSYILESDLNYKNPYLLEYLNRKQFKPDLIMNKVDIDEILDIPLNNIKAIQNDLNRYGVVKIKTPKYTLPTNKLAEVLDKHSKMNLRYIFQISDSDLGDLEYVRPIYTYKTLDVFEDRIEVYGLLSFVGQIDFKFTQPMSNYNFLCGRFRQRTTNTISRYRKRGKWIFGEIKIETDRSSDYDAYFGKDGNLWVHYPVTFIMNGDVETINM